MLTTCSLSGVQFYYTGIKFNCDKSHPLCGISLDDAHTALDWLTRHPDKLRTEEDLQNRLGVLRIASIRIGIHYKFLADKVDFDTIPLSTSQKQADPAQHYQLIADAAALRSLVRGYEFLGQDFPTLAHLGPDSWVSFLNTCRDITRELEWDVAIMHKRTVGTLFKVYEVASLSLGELETYCASALSAYPDAVGLAGRLFKICIKKLHGLTLQDSHIQDASSTVEGLLSSFTEHWSEAELFAIGTLLMELDNDQQISIGMAQAASVLHPWLTTMTRKVEARKTKPAPKPKEPSKPERPKHRRPRRPI